MEKYDVLWLWIAANGTDGMTLSYDDIERIAGCPVDHSFLNCKKRLLPFGWKVDKISMKQKTIRFVRTEQSTLKTERLLLRPWQEDDAESLFRYASDPEIGPPAGWPPHKDISESLEVIRHVFCGPECYAICLKEDGVAIGAVELKLVGRTDMTDKPDECELGYWIGKPFWGNGYMPEAAGALLARAFEVLGMRRVWCGYYDGNRKSKRVQ